MQNLRSLLKNKIYQRHRNNKMQRHQLVAVGSSSLGMSVSLSAVFLSLSFPFLSLHFPFTFLSFPFPSLSFPFTSLSFSFHFPFFSFILLFIHFILLILIILSDSYRWSQRSYAFWQSCIVFSRRD